MLARFRKGSSVTYSVVKFMVNVRLMENRVKSHVGRVIVVKVINQNSNPGIMLKKNSANRPSAANMEVIPFGSGEVGGEVCWEKVAVVEEITDPKVCKEELRPAAGVGEASGVSMEYNQPRIRSCDCANWSTSCHAASEASTQVTTL